MEISAFDFPILFIDFYAGIFIQFRIGICTLTHIPYAVMQNTNSKKIFLDFLVHEMFYFTLKGKLLEFLEFCRTSRHKRLKILLYFWFFFLQ